MAEPKLSPQTLAEMEEGRKAVKQAEELLLRQQEQQYSAEAPAELAPPDDVMIESSVPKRKKSQ